MREKLRIILLYLSAVLIYGIIVSFFTSTVHIDVDEELYLALAKSFHYRGRFEYGNQLVNYSCVLYSMLISLAYFFYSPETILFTMRMIGVITMCSAVFPVFFLSKNVLSDEKRAFLISAFVLIMPYMFDSAYLMQEVLSYPLFLWTLYFLYQTFEREDSRNKAFPVLAAIFSVLCVFTKTYLFFVPITLNLCSLYCVIKRKNGKEYILDTVLYDVIYFISFIGFYFLLLVINGFESGSNHYSGQFSKLFPLDLRTLIFGVIGCVIYLAFFVINTGLFSVGVMFCRQRSEKQKSWMTSFVSASIVFLVLEIVFMVVLTEEGKGSLPHKFLFRYFQIFVPILLIWFFKYSKEYHLMKSYKFLIAMEVILGIALLYFLFMKGDTRQAIIDGHLFLFIENLTEYIMPYADALIIAFLMLTLLVFYIIFHQKVEDMNLFIKTGVAGMIVFWCIEIVQLPYYSNIIAEGKQVESDSIRIAQYLNENNYESVYYVYGDVQEKNSYLRNFYGYIRQSYEIIPRSEMKQALCREDQQKTALLSPIKVLDDVPELQQADLGNEKLFLYTLR